MQFGQMVTAARERSRLSLLELAEKVGASSAVLGSIESAGHIPRDPLISRLVRVLKLNEQAVMARIIRQRTSRFVDADRSRDESSLLTAVPVIGRITKDS